LGYIQGTEPKQPQTSPPWLPGADPECFLCRAAADNQERENLVVLRNPHCLVLLNRYPYNNGHLLVAPLEHRATLDQLSGEMHLEMMQCLTRMTGLLQRLIKADGFNIGLNLGRVAGAGVPGHLHWHLVPRWHGDTNFMPVVAGAHVIPQSLDALLTLLHEALLREALPHESASGEVEQTAAAPAASSGNSP
jgi:ATP adenylyltransferase